MIKQQETTKMDDAFAIQLQLSDGCAACWRQSDQVKLVRAPGKMLVPVVPSWMKERNSAASGGIEGLSLVMFGTIASLTGQGQIILGALTTLALRDDMFDRVQLRRAELRAEAVFTIAQRALPDPSSPLGRNPLPSHGAQVGGRAA